MLANMSPALFKFWKELYRVKPWGDDWEQAGTIAAAAHNAGLIAAGCKMPEEYMRIRAPQDYYKFKPKRKRKSNKDQQQPILAVLAAKYGPKV